MTVKEKYEYFKQRTTDAGLIKELDAMSGAELEEAFFKDLEFGTAGIRGIMGAGTNRLNIYTVKKVTAGLCVYLKAKGGGSVCISYDSRHNSREFARLAACVLAADGIKAIITERLMPTPFLSFMVRHYSAAAGIMITASHNPKEYNGYKVYDADGCQLTDIDASVLAGFIKKADGFDVEVLSFEEHVKQGLITEQTPTDIYIEAVKSQLEALNTHDMPQPVLKAMYTPLHGTGSRFVADILENCEVVEEQVEPDGNFPTCPSPNPENDAAFSTALRCAKKKKSDIIVATDPDADRVGVMVLHGGEYRRLSGNEVGALLTDYLLRENSGLTVRGVPSDGRKKIERPIIVRTVVSTPIVDKIAAKYSAEIKEVLTGFKYIGEYIGELEKRGEDGRFLLGFEESCGYLSGSYVRDKDGVLASCLICLMAKSYNCAGMTLIDAMNKLYDEHGYHLHKTFSYRFEGAEGNRKIYEVMEKLRRNPPAEMGLPVTAKKDYMVPQGDLPLTNMMEFTLDGGCAIVRPSGTEPLVKVYITAIGAKEETEKSLAIMKAFWDSFLV